MKIRLTISLLVAFVIAASGLLQSFRQAARGPKPLKQEIPFGFPPPVYTFRNNPLTQEGFELGRRLFYDGRLSRDNFTACASCHQQHGAFADFEHILSHGNNGLFTLRNAPPLFNLAWHKDFHLDGGINHIEVQPLAPITAHNEMDSNMDSIIHKLQLDSSYSRMFDAVFGDPGISSQRILKALAQFTGTLVSAGSRYDQMRMGKIRFEDREYRGYQVFRTRCAGCHAEPLFTDLSYRNIGLPLDTVLKDAGRMRITGNKADSLKFKVPSLRNVARTNPYMHDGRFWGLVKAVNHWQTRSRSDSTVDPLLREGAPLSQEEVFWVISFLHTLTDSAFLKNRNLVDTLYKGGIHQ